MYADCSLCSQVFSGTALTYFQWYVVHKMWYMGRTGVTVLSNKLFLSRCSVKKDYVAYHAVHVPCCIIKACKFKFHLTKNFIDLKVSSERLPIVS